MGSRPHALELLGYETARALALEAHRTGRPALDLVRDRRLLTGEQLRALTTPQALTGGPVG